ncbi:small ribosomal subunit protein bTHXm [Typha latifolia]|uniref:small ribosomal subunit protein bTHXm n=1 Tax=Typha latifolia TaxID=4733 RepID=UPI003C2E40E2
MAMRWVARRAMQSFHRPFSSFSPVFPAAASSSVASAQMVPCGRGDKKTKRGKRFKGSYGNARPKKEKKIERIKDRVEVPRSTPWPLPFKLI